MIRLYDKESGAAVGTISDEQFHFLQEHLEIESPEDDDYYLNQSTLDMFEEEGIDAGLLTTLRTALGEREEMEIRWERS